MKFGCGMGGEMVKTLIPSPWQYSRARGLRPSWINQGIAIRSFSLILQMVHFHDGRHTTLFEELP